MKTLCLAFALLGGCALAQAQIYRCGNSYSQSPCDAAAKPLTGGNVSVLPAGPSWAPGASEALSYGHVPRYGDGGVVVIGRPPEDKFKDYKQYDSSTTVVVPVFGGGHHRHRGW